MTRVVVNGTFDLLHFGHLKLLEYARAWPNSFVYVLIDSDRRVKELKGSDRPVNSEYERSYLLSSLKFVDKVDIFDSNDELRNYIKNYDPDVMVKGKEYRDKPIIGSEYCKEIYFYESANVSTTGKIQSILNRR